MKKLISLLLAAALLLGAVPAVFAAEETPVYEGSLTVSAPWTEGVGVMTSLVGGTVNPVAFTPGGSFAVEYTGTEGQLYLVLSDLTSWGWNVLYAPDYTEAGENGGFVSYFSYASCLAAYPEDTLDTVAKIVVGTTNSVGDTVITKVSFIPGDGETVIREATLLEGSFTPAVWDVTACQINTTLWGGSFNPGMIVEGGGFSVAYTGTEGELLLALNGAAWKELKPSATYPSGDGYISWFTYDDCVAAYGSDFATLGAIHAVSIVEGTTFTGVYWGEAQVQQPSEPSEPVGPIQGATRDDPIFPEFKWNEAMTQATASVTVPGGTYWCAVYGGAGMLLSIDGGQSQVLAAEGLGRVPAYFTVENTSEQEKTFQLTLSYPLGSYANPERISEVNGYSDTVTLEAGDSDGYCYAFTASQTGEVTLYFTSVPEGVEADILVTNNTTYAQRTLLEDGVDNFGLELTVSVQAGQELVIQIAVLPNEKGEYPAAELGWQSVFAYPLGSKENPIFPEFTWNEAGSQASASVTVAPGTAWCAVNGGAGMLLSIDGGEPMLLTAEGVGRVPAYFTLENTTQEEKTYQLTLSYPEGSYSNPQNVELGSHTAVLAAGTQGYYYSYTAQADGFLLVRPVEQRGWFFSVNNVTAMHYGSWHSSSDPEAVAYEVVSVSAGDQVTVLINTHDPEKPYDAPAGTVAWEIVSFLGGDVDGNGSVNGKDRTLLARYLAGWEGWQLPDAPLADVNADGKVDGRDRTALARHLAGWEGYETLPQAQSQ